VPQVGVLADLCKDAQVSEYRDLWHPETNPHRPTAWPSILIHIRRPDDVAESSAQWIIEQQLQSRAKIPRKTRYPCAIDYREKTVKRPAPIPTFDTSVGCCNARSEDPGRRGGWRLRRSGIFRAALTRRGWALLALV
jgi:hypothetical protein